MAALYVDFGDVREDDFHKWWTQDARCIRLFAEQPLTVKFAELASPTEWQPQWTADDAMVLVVPLRVSKRRLKGIFAKMLDQRHTGTRGRPAVANQVSSARYQLQHNYTIQSLQTGLSVYDLWLANQQLGTPDRMTLWELGVKAGLNKKAAKDAVSTLSQDRLVGRNVLAATVSRYVKQANAVIANAGLGLFPLY